MKIILIIILLIYYNNIYCQYYNNEKGKKEKKQTIQEKSKYVFLKIITLGNEDNYFEGKLHIYTDFLIDSLSLRNSDTLIKYLDKPDYKGSLLIKIRTKHNMYTVYDKHYGINDDTLNFVLDYNSLSYKQEEQKIIFEEKEFKQQKLLEYETILKMMIIAYEKGSFYEKKIKGKSRNKIADYLYDENFSHNFSSNTLGEYFSSSWGNDKIYYEITIELWYSYGYGSLYYNINYYFYYKGWDLSANDPYEFRYFDQKGILVKFNLEDFNEN